MLEVCGNVRLSPVTTLTLGTRELKKPVYTLCWRYKVFARHLRDILPARVNYTNCILYSVCSLSTLFMEEWRTVRYSKKELLT